MNEDQMKNELPQQTQSQVVDTTTPPAATQQTQQTPGEVQDAMDYRELLSSQIMAEQARANASKYVMGGLQSSGVAQTGVAQSILSGIQSSYQNTLAQNVNQYMMLQQERQAGELSATQQNAMNTATTLLQEPGLTQEEYDYIYQTYYNQLSPQDQQTFQFLYDRIGRQYGFGEGSTQTETVSNEVSDYLFNNFDITENIVAYTNTNLNQSLTLSDSYKPNLNEEATQQYLDRNGAFDLTKFEDNDNFVRWSEGVTRGNVEDGTIIAVEFKDLPAKINYRGDVSAGVSTSTVYFHFVVYKGKLYRIPQNKAVNKVNRRFKFSLI